MTSSQDGRRLELAVTNLEACGVESCVQPSGERWLCLTIRFPLIAGIHLPEDDVIQIQCRPQDPSQTAGKQLIVQATGFESLSPVEFSGGRQEFECEVALFRRTPGSEIFSTVVGAGDTITLGEELHLRSIIRAGDGWQFSKLTDVLVERVAADGGGLPSDSAPLVFSDGCRNQDLTLIAPDHPARHQTNQLISNFAFRVFTFQGMESGDRLQVSARVTGCVEAADCAPAVCSDGGQGFGRRRRRDARLNGANTTDWRQNLAFSVVIPDTHALSQRPLPAAEPPVPVAARPGGCPAALLASLVAALAGCLLLLLTAVCLLNVRQQRRLKAACRQKPPPPPPEQQQRCGGQMAYHECVTPPLGGSEGIEWPPNEPQRWPLDGAITAPRGRCTERRLRRRRADVRRSFSAGSLRCGCAQREGKGGSEETAAKQPENVNVSIVRVPAEENIYSEPRPHWDVAPTMV
ncbi:uncharacterized protein LOC122392733 isoform X2 [Amphibalanus amphitrite]|uniref:uncharacterized protein LOC122392733 isoform X2 n=1 Tax=Amphibalanus amphitrite TaxID=1232801 RepID=UPI001C910065|nr:uncharacterized protein LOC122392733 isoform X2 [Amphibalanus amphitrite]